MITKTIIEKESALNANSPKSMKETPAKAIMFSREWFKHFKKRNGY